MQRAHLRLALFLCGVWSITLLYGEMLAFWIPLWSCSWPSLLSANSSSSSSSEATAAAAAAAEFMDDGMKVAVLADLQLMDRTSLRLPPGSFALETAQFYTDIYMRRSFRSSVLPFKPDLVLFLGDLFDGGPYLSDKEWQDSLIRFRHIFVPNVQGRCSYTPAYYLSGNHDIGYSRLHSLYPNVIKRHENEFGPRNFRFTIGRVKFIAVDAQTLDGSIHGNETSSSWNFIKNISSEATLYPRVLLTHIPLFRHDDTPCGRFRSSPVINQRISRADPNQEVIYQNYLSKESSESLLQLIKPILVLSGHDHDQCSVTHSTPSGPVEEHTLGTLSWQQGNLYPSFMLMSVTSSSPSSAANPKNAVSTQLCFLPMQTHIYLWYLFQFVVTLLLLVMWPANGFGCYDLCMSTLKAVGQNFLTAPNKEKIDDDDDDYEMVWDAEGSMHLVKKESSKPPTTKLEAVSRARGSAVTRAAAKKHSVLAQEEVSIPVEINTDAASLGGGTGRTPRSGAGKCTKLIRRIARVLHAASIISAVNIPLYVMLLFNDWI